MGNFYINQRDEHEGLYRNLQAASLHALQQLAGEVWTDYNAHDPGVTIVEVLNYALTELDYRLKFNFEDYLRDESSPFVPADLGLFTSKQVFAPAVVTAEDYRRMFRDAMDGVEDVRMVPAPGMDGRVDLFVELSSLVRKSDTEKMKGQVKDIFNAHRNLCEGLNEVNIIRRKELLLCGVIEMFPGTDATGLLASIYWETNRFFRTQEQERPVAVLFQHLRTLKGIKAVYSLRLLDNGSPVHKTGTFCSVKIPEKRGDAGLCLQVDDKEVIADIEKVIPLVNRHFHYSEALRREKPEEICITGTYRAIYSHDTIQNELPGCYGINRQGLGQNESALRRAQAKQLKTYLLLFDQTMGRGLSELSELKQLMNLEARLPAGLPPVPEDPEVKWEELADVEKAAKRRAREVLDEKEHLADMWDRLYGEDSSPVWLKEYNYYDDSREQQLQRRVRFLRRVPEWGRERFRSYNLRQERSAENVPGVKDYVSALLGWEADEGHPVVNIFPAYNLKLMDDERYYAGPVGMWNHDLLTEELLREENMERIPYREMDCTDTDYDRLRQEMPLFHHNLIFEGLFREGIRLENYRLVNIPLHQDRLLVFYHRERDEWINLGRFSDKSELIWAANCLQRFLVMLNRKSETLYLVEHLYLTPSDPFVLTVVFPGWSARMANGRFRAACEGLVCGRLPAHLDVRIRWLEVTGMWMFEKAWRDWRKALAEEEDGVAAEAAGRICEIIK